MTRNSDGDRREPSEEPSGVLASDASEGSAERSSAGERSEPRGSEDERSESSEGSSGERNARDGDADDVPLDITGHEAERARREDGNGTTEATAAEGKESDAGVGEAVLAGDVLERSVRDRVVVGDTALAFGVSPGREHLAVVEPTVR